MSQADRFALALTTQAIPVPETGRIVVLNAAPSAALESLPRDRLTAEQGDRVLHDRLDAMDIDVKPVVSGGSAAAVFVNLRRNKIENLGQVSRGLSMLSPGGLLAVNGAKHDGIDSISRQLGKLLPLEGAFVKSHGRIVSVIRPDGPLPDTIAGWASAAAPALNRDGFLTAPGMFSSDAPDPGSLRLAEAFDKRVKGHVADLGAGWGWLSAAALDRCPGISAIDLFEASHAALEAARKNVTDPRASFYWSDVSTLRQGNAPFDTVITNPPFHQGHAADPTLGAGFITTAAALLKPSGTLFLVANRQLPYESTLEASFTHWERRSEDGMYKVIVATRPRRTRR